MSCMAAEPQARTQQKVKVLRHQQNSGQNRAHEGLLRAYEGLRGLVGLCWGAQAPLGRLLWNMKPLAERIKISRLKCTCFGVP